MTKSEHSKASLKKMEELHRLPLMILAWGFTLYLVKDMTAGILLGAGALLGFLVLEGSRLFFERFLPPFLQAASYLIMAVSLAGIMGIVLHLLQMPQMDAPFYWFILEQAASIYLLKTLLCEMRKEKKRAAEETGEETQGEEEHGKQVLKTLLTGFETGVEYMVFLGILGVAREYAGKWIPFVYLFSGGFLITAGLLLVWRLTKTMPGRLKKLPGMTLSTGLIGLVLAGFAGLF